MNEAWQGLDPMDPEIVLWRYIDFGKFKSMMSDSSLHFARAATFSDPYEGHDPQGDRILFPHPDPAKSSEDMRITISHVQKWFSTNLYVVCWNRQERESERMWSEYLGCSNGVAIRTTVGRLWNSFCNSQNVGIGAVVYIDSDIKSLGTDAAVMKFFFKRRKYTHEKEVRAIWSENMYHGRGGPERFAEFGAKGVFLKVDLGALIEEIAVNATRDDKFFAEVRAFATQHGLVDRVVPSIFSWLMWLVFRGALCSFRG